jgi:TIR domain.
LKDFFLSHSSQDKPLVKRVAATLIAKGRTYWLDQAEILPGDSLVEKVFSSGLKNCRFVILFLSKSFLNKEWPKAELDTVIARQIRQNKKTIIPFLVDIQHEELVKSYPYFENIYCGNATEDFDLMITQLENLLERDSAADLDNSMISSASLNISAIPKIETNDFFDGLTKFPEVREISRIVESVLVSYHRAPQDLNVDVIEFASGTYMGNCNYSFWGPEQAGPYKSLHPQISPIAAVNDALSGIHSFDSSDYPDRLVFWVGDSEIIYDGEGQQVTIEEAHRRRNQNIKSFRKKDWTNTTINGGPWWLISKNFDTKEFSVTGPIEDDRQFISMCMAFQEKGIDFRLETVPANKDTKESLETYFQQEYEMRLVTFEDLYKTTAPI